MMNTLRGHLAEFGIMAANGQVDVEAILAILLNDQDAPIPNLARENLIALAYEMGFVKQRILEAHRTIMNVHRPNPASGRQETIACVDPVIATHVTA